MLQANKCFRFTMYRDAPMTTVTKSDGMISLQHCQEWSFAFLFYKLVQYINAKLKWIFSRIKNLIKSINVSCRSNVLDTLLKNRNSIVSFILVSIKAWRIRAENRRERKKLTTFFHFPKSVCALRKIVRNDARRSQNASTLIVTGII